MKRVIAFAALVAPGLTVGVTAAQESYPSRPISIVSAAITRIVKVDAKQLTAMGRQGQ